MHVPDVDLHGQDVGGGVVLQEVAQVTQVGHEEVGAEVLQLAVQEAALGRQGRTSRGPWPGLQPHLHLRVRLTAHQTHTGGTAYGTGG